MTLRRLTLRVTNQPRPLAGGRVTARRHWRSKPPAKPGAVRLRSALTLIELLITIMIIGMLAAMVLGVAAVAGNSAREAKTRNIVNRIHTLLMEQADTYKSRRVKVQKVVVDEINASSLSAAQKGAALAEARLYALREMMLMEMPDRWSDVWLADWSSGPPASPFFLDAPTVRFSGSVSANRTELGSVYLRRSLRIQQQLSDAGLSSTEIFDRLIENQSAECLYMVVMLACGDGEAPSMFHESDVGDTDGDGAPELLDGWGNPISFLRWAPGFESEIQLNLNIVEAMPPTDANQAVASDHDPYDMYRVDPRAFRLVPLVYSAGQDEEYGLHDEPDFVAWRSFAGDPSLTFDPLNGPPFIRWPRLSPYERGVSSFPVYYLGTAEPTIKTSIDNIHNHLIGTR